MKKQKQPISEPLILAKKTEMFKKRAPKGLQKGDSISGVAPLGAPLEPQVDFWFKKWAHSAPQSAPGTEKTLKLNPLHAQSDPKDQKILQKWSPSAPERGLLNCTADLHIWPGGLREAL